MVVLVVVDDVAVDEVDVDATTRSSSSLSVILDREWDRDRDVMMRC